jgi:hypothetical protein
MNALEPRGVEPAESGRQRRRMSPNHTTVELYRRSLSQRRFGIRSHHDRNTMLGEHRHVPCVILMPVCHDHAPHIERAHGVQYRRACAMKPGVDHDAAHHVHAHVHPDRSARPTLEAHPNHIVESLDAHDSDSAMAVSADRPPFLPGLPFATAIPEG